MRVLGIETTCDETAAAIVERRSDGTAEILSNEVMSQIRQHAAYGGVVPEIAARAHVDVLDRLILRAVEKAGMTIKLVDGMAAAAGPGLIGGVIVGLTAGKALALALHKPFVAINHLEAHALTPRLTDQVPFPYLLLLVSGGHTQLVAVKGVGDYLRLGATLDDAVGEAFDKIAKMLGLPYPGGPLVERHAAGGDPERFAFPRPMLGRPRPDFSLSGLKTAVRLAADDIKPLTATDVNDLCASFQAAVVDTIIDRIRVATRLFREKVGPCEAIVAAGWCRVQRCHPPRDGALLRRSRAAPCHPATEALHRQWRDDRLGRAGAARARPHRRHDLRRPAAVAARRPRRGGTSRQGVRKEPTAPCQRFTLGKLSQIDSGLFPLRFGTVRSSQDVNAGSC